MGLPKRSAAVLAVILVVLLSLLSHRVWNPRAPLPVRSAPQPAAAAKPPPAKAAAPAAAPPPLVIHTELIPKRIAIARVYYAQTLNAPGGETGFDINGSGFDREFREMITVESGEEAVGIKDLRLVTPDQIHGTFVIGERAATSLVFPRVLIHGKTVFRAPEPFAVIRPGEVLNLTITGVGANGRSGRLRVFTNLTEEMFRGFTVASSSGGIVFSPLEPRLPFVVDGNFEVGGLATGAYGLSVRLGEKVLWDRGGMIRVMKPNVGATGLIQRIEAADVFHRPGDRARFAVRGSGFQAPDVQALEARVVGLGQARGAFEFVSAGELGLTLDLPLKAGATAYALEILSGGKSLFEAPQAFSIVAKNWTRSVSVEPALSPGRSGAVVLSGRGLDEGFVGKLKVSVDEPGLKIGEFQWVSPERATAEISAGEGVAPGDYWIKMVSGGKTVRPALGSIIQIGPRK